MPLDRLAFCASLSLQGFKSGCLEADLGQELVWRNICAISFVFESTGCLQLLKEAFKPILKEEAKFGSQT